jgi:hypothetical protein
MLLQYLLMLTEQRVNIDTCYLAVLLKCQMTQTVYKGSHDRKYNVGIAKCGII